MLLILAAFSISGLQAQDAEKPTRKIIVEPATLNLQLGETAQLNARVVNADGETLPDSVIYFAGNRQSRRAIEVSTTGMVKAIKAGEWVVRVRTVSGNRNNAISTMVPVTVPFPPVTSVEITGTPGNVYAGTRIPLTVAIEDATGEMRDNVEYTIKSSAPEVASVDAFNNLRAHKTGSFTLTVQAENVSSTWKQKVIKNPVSSIVLSRDYMDRSIRTGDVVHFTADAMTSGGDKVEDAPVFLSFTAQPDDNLGQGAAGQIEQDGRFVANKPGIYTVTARSGNSFEEHTFRVVPRNVQRPVEVVGKGIVSHTRTSDLWVWEGIDGKDYAVTGTWGGNGEAIFWNVTDPTNIIPIDTVTVDARTVNDVKVNERGDIAVITREGASNRKNGIIILDVSDPSDVSILSEYTQDLTGGVHNTFIYEDHVYAVNNGRKYDIINIEDPANPYTVSKFELDTPGHSIHDVWIEDGIAYSSNWSDGVIAVDIGSNTSSDMPGAGGSPENPVQLGSYTYPSGWNHAAFPFKSQSTGDFYVAAGDEAFPYGLNVNGANRAAGWVHFIKFDGWDQPEEVARYQVPEAGSHNYWIKDDVLYAAFYNGGLRIVDISGELMGNLYEQGREIANFFPQDSEAFIPNATFTWGPQPYKGHIFLSDWTSGIWALKLGESTAEGTN